MYTLDYNKYLKHNKIIVFLLTYLSYSSLHIARKIFSNIKNNLTDQWNFSENFLAKLDTTFMSAYGFGLILNGYFADKHGSKPLMVCCLIGTSLFFFTFPLLKVMGIESKGIYYAIWILNGFFQSMGWPSTVNIMSKWFEKEFHSFVFGIWASNASIGNILGNIIISICQKYNLHIMTIFAIPTVILFILSILSYCFIIQEPDKQYFEVHVPEPNIDSLHSNSTYIHIYQHKRKIRLNNISYNDNNNNKSNILVYALSFLFLKTVNYTLFFWLSYYLHENFHIQKYKSDLISCLYDVGGIIGSIITGMLLLKIKKYNILTVSMLLLSIIPLILLKYTKIIQYIDINIIVLGYLLAGPSTIISTMVAVKLGNDKTKSTIVGFIDGLGSLGCGLFQIFIPYITLQYGWQYIFIFLIGFIAMSIICLICKSKQELCNT